MQENKPASNLEEYRDVLHSVSAGAPKFSAPRAGAVYTPEDVREYETEQASMELLSQIERGELSAKDNSWIPLEEAEEALEVQDA